MSDEGAEGQVPEGAAGSEVNPEAGSQDQQEGQTTTTDTNDWRSAISDEGQRKLAERFNSPADLVKSYAEMNKEFNNRVKRPGEDATPEDMAKFYKAMGLPENTEAYKFERPEGMAEDTFNSEATQAELGQLAELVHNNISNPVKLAQELINLGAQSTAQRQEAQKAADERFIADGEAALRTEWGSDYDANKAFAEQAAASDPVLAEIKNYELNNGMLMGQVPGFLKFMAQYGRMTSEGGLQAGLKGSERGTDLQKTYDDMTADFFAAMDAGDVAKAKRINTDRERISEQLHGTAPVVGR